jgi:UDP:flavonoid glycosyltransferase YjiC (YdhE family)
MAALRYGIPMVCVPGFGDQPDVAARVVHLGAGILLSTTSTVDEFREAISAIIEGPSYREEARRLAEVLSAEDGASRAADEIETVARS